MRSFQKPELFEVRANSVKNKKIAMDMLETERIPDFSSAMTDMIESLPFRNKIYGGRNRRVKSLVHMTIRRENRENGEDPGDEEEVGRVVFE
jgi:hypothetical protein